MLNKRKVSLFLLALAVLTVSTAAYSLAASNTVPANVLGEGAGIGTSWSGRPLDKQRGQSSTLSFFYALSAIGLFPCKKAQLGAVNLLGSLRALLPDLFAGLLQVLISIQEIHQVRKQRR